MSCWHRPISIASPNTSPLKQVVCDPVKAMKTLVNAEWDDDNEVRVVETR